MTTVLIELEFDKEYDLFTDEEIVDRILCNSDYMLENAVFSVQRDDDDDEYSQDSGFLEEEWLDSSCS
jgi:hypothetical protein